MIDTEKLNGDDKQFYQSCAKFFTMADNLRSADGT